MEKELKVSPHLKRVVLDHDSHDDDALVGADTHVIMSAGYVQHNDLKKSSRPDATVDKSGTG